MRCHPFVDLCLVKHSGIFHHFFLIVEIIESHSKLHQEVFDANPELQVSAFQILDGSNPLSKLDLVHQRETILIIANDRRYFLEFLGYKEHFGREEVHV